MKKLILIFISFPFCFFLSLTSHGAELPTSSDLVEKDDPLSLEGFSHIVSPTREQVILLRKLLELLEYSGNPISQGYKAPLKVDKKFKKELILILWQLSNQKQVPLPLSVRDPRNPPAPLDSNRKKDEKWFYAAFENVIETYSNHSDYQRSFHSPTFWLNRAKLFVSYPSSLNAMMSPATTQLKEDPVIDMAIDALVQMNESIQPGNNWYGNLLKTSIDGAFLIALGGEPILLIPVLLQIPAEFLLLEELPTTLPKWIHWVWKNKDLPENLWARRTGFGTFKKNIPIKILFPEWGTPLLVSQNGMEFYRRNRLDEDLDSQGAFKSMSLPEFSVSSFLASPPRLCKDLILN